MIIRHEYWPYHFGVTYILLGLLAFFLPTNDWYEITMRIIFILLGIAILLAQKKHYAVYLLVIGVGILDFLVVWDFVQIIQNWDNLLYRVHLASLPLWLFFIIRHFKAISEVSDD